MFFIYPYRTGSRSVRALKDALNDTIRTRIIKLENSRYRPRPEHVVINWGNSEVQPWADGHTVLNHPVSVARSSNKHLAFHELSRAEVSIPRYTTDIRHAQYWCDDGYTVFCRTKLRGHSGDGIVVANDRDEVVEAPLYTRGINLKGEYRVHVFDGEVILYQKKSRRVDEDGEVIVPENASEYVRNLESGWIYRTGNLKRLERVEQIALDAIEALELDFGAVDIAMDTEGDVYVLEVNTAPGLGNQDTLEAYTDAIINIMT
tara:strand:+ start:44323 stop:45105 length:783 start_codon:yes stop_codon:yes gene_type:complete